MPTATNRNETRAESDNARAMTDWRDALQDTIDIIRNKKPAALLPERHSVTWL
jgi:hypothetical protein